VALSLLINYDAPCDALSACLVLFIVLSTLSACRGLSDSSVTHCKDWPLNFAFFSSNLQVSCYNLRRFGANGTLQALVPVDWGKRTPLIKTVSLVRSILSNAKFAAF
jgi:hypothetical protein